MPNTPRMSWTYPSENQKPFFDAIADFFGQQDASAYAAREDRHIIFTGGGTVSYSSGTLSWTDDFRILAAITGFTWRVAANSVSLDDGQLLYVDLVRAPSSNLALTPQVASQVPNTDSALVLAIRVGSTIFFPNGVSVPDGGSIPGLGGILEKFFNQALAATVTGTTFENVGSLYIPAGELKAPARVFMGATTVGPDAAEVELRRETGGTLIATWNATGLLQEAVQGTDVTIPAADWYSLRLRGNGVSVVAALRGIDWVVES